MKRVHDHKEEPVATTGSPALGDLQGQRKVGGRKRKASAPLPAEPVAQRQRFVQSPQQPLEVAPVIPLPQGGYQMGATLYSHDGYQQDTAPLPRTEFLHGHAPSSRDIHPQGPAPFQQRDIGNQQLRDPQHRQRVIHPQRANQRDLIARQGEFVQSPDDEANFQRLSQNMDELRRLSNEARRG
ncbi:hypothetical protein LTR08_002878 [Meristemomyces frigidus]|nr:hypothetical protein LTR08_002878 [Meristemomyces frigidus]